MNKRGIYRAMPVMQIRIQETGEKTYRVSGYATTFEPYLYFEYNGVQYFESFTRDCFDNVDINDDVIMQYDHRGRVFARTGNGTLRLALDDHGLEVEADLSRTELSRSVYEDIESGMTTKMSWGFLTRCDPVFNRRTNTFEWPKGSISKVLDVSAVSLPANNDTNIDARGIPTDEEIQRILRNAQEACGKDADIRARMRIRDLYRR